MGFGGSQGGWGFFLSWLIRGFSSKHPDAQNNTENIHPSVENLDPVNGNGVTVLMCEQSYQRQEKLYQEEIFQPLHPQPETLEGTESEEDVE